MPSPDESLIERRHTPLVFVDDLLHPELSASDHHHFSRVRRVGDGDEITISDGQGRWCAARFGIRPEPAGEIVTEPSPASTVTVGFTPVKAERPDWVIQKLTELGVDVILPLQTERSVVRWDRAKAEKHLVKWAVVAKEAAMQCRRVRLPRIEPVTPLASLPSSASTVLADPEGDPIEPGDHTILIGPEGGWADGEIAGRTLRSLPGGILRAETAAIAAATLLVAARGAR